MTDIPVASGADMMAVVRDALHGEDVYRLSKRIGVSTSAIYAIRRGKTRWPRDYTLFAINLDLGIEIFARRKKR